MKSRSLLALTASALALQGVSMTARADTPPTQSNIGYRVSIYEEDNLPEEFLFMGSPERYDITIHQFQLVTPIGENYGLTLNSNYESMSGASPWYALPQFEGEKSIVMSGATIHEQRRDYNLSLRRYQANGNFAFHVGTSRENDYDSWSGGFDMARNFNNDMTTIAGGISISNDDINPTDSALFNRVTDESKRTSSAFVSVSQIIDQNSLLQSSVNMTRHKGFLTDPYKLGDSRPNLRSQWAWSNAYRRFINSLDAALHLDVRLYKDDFGVNSLTLDAAWYQNLGDNWQITPSIRYYSQSAADFFTPANDFSLFGAPNSSDYRLASYGAVSAGLQVQTHIDDISLIFIVERYVTDADYSIHNGQSSPALVNFTRMSLGVSYTY